MVLLSHPTGNSFVRAAANGLLKAGMLFEFHTTIASFEGSLLDSVSSVRFFSELKRRRYEPGLKQKTSTWPWVEAGRQIALKAGITKFTRHETGPFSIDAVFQSLDKRVAARLRNAPQHVDSVYAYEDGALFSFQQAKKAGIQCFYDLPIGYWKTARTMLEPERERWPEWIPTLTGFGDSAAKLERKDEELRLADRIFVASRFTANTLKDFQGNLAAPISVIPYGFPPAGAVRDYSPIAGRRPVKLLFVGGLSQRKGIADLFATVESLKDYVELTIVGHKPNNDCPALDNALAKYKWIPSLPHEGILRIMREHDVLIFPSLFEGFGLVITEAMSQGTPVITTERTAGPDLIKHGENGWLINAGSTQALKAAIEELLLKPDRIAEIGREAMETATRRPWERYGEEIAAEILQHKHIKNLLHNSSIPAP